MAQSKFFREVLLFYILLAIAVYVTYVYKFFALPFFVGMLIWAWLSKRDYFFIAFFFIILQTPAYFFTNTPDSGPPLITPFPRISFTPTDMFTVLLFLKVFFYKKPVKMQIKVPFMILTLYLIFSFISGAISSGSIKTPIIFFRPVFHLTWLISFLGLVNTREKVFRFLYLLLPIVFFILFTQFYILTNNQEFINVFVPFERTLITNTLTGETRPVPGAWGLLLLCYIGAMLLAPFQTNKISKQYTYCMMTLAFISVLISATRFIFGMFFCILVGVYFSRLRSLGNIIIVIGVAVLALTIFINTGLLTDTYVRESIFSRVLQVFMLVQGEGHHIDTFGSRIQGLQPMLQRIRDNIFLGYGFSDISAEYYDNNWGFFNTVLMFGVVGLIIFCLLAIAYLKLVFRTMRRLPFAAPARTALLVLGVSLLSFLGGYALTWDLFSMTYGYQVAFITIFFALCEHFAARDIPQEKEVTKISS